MDELKIHISISSSFQGMIALIAPTLPPLGAGAQCDASALQKRGIFRQLRTGTTA
jgi:hypothetical protein